MAVEASCIFCEIANGKIPSHKIWEDQDYVAILDAFPNIRGQSLVISKKHLNSYAFALSDSEYKWFMTAVKAVAKLLERGLAVPRVHMVLEGTGINHLHAKLYPAIGMGSRDERLVAPEKVHFERYEGYVTTLMGERADDAVLETLAKQIRENGSLRSSSKSIHRKAAKKR